MRRVDTYHLATEQGILATYADAKGSWPHTCRRLAGEYLANDIGEAVLGPYHSEDARRLASTDPALIERFLRAGKEAPMFLEAGPRSDLAFDPRTVTVAIATPVF